MPNYRISSRRQRVEEEVELRGYQRKQRKFPPLPHTLPQQGPTFGIKVKRTNLPGTCLFCGKKLVRTRERGLGAYADNAFCGLRCGYSFGNAFAVSGRRLLERQDKQ